jgi:hypothetical protein
LRRRWRDGKLRTTHNIQYALFCSDFIENASQVSILGVFDGADVWETIERGQPMQERSFPSEWSWASTPGRPSSGKLGITRPSGGIMTSVGLEGFESRPGEIVHRCIANLDMEVSEDGVYSFTVPLDGSQIGWAVCP